MLYLEIFRMSLRMWDISELSIPRSTGEIIDEKEVLSPLDFVDRTSYLHRTLPIIHMILGQHFE